MSRYIIKNKISNPEKLKNLITKSISITQSFHHQTIGFSQGKILHIHILGICGTFMAGLAGFAVQMGHKVTGQDKAYYPPMSNQLTNLGIKEKYI